MQIHVNTGNEGGGRNDSMGIIAFDIRGAADGEIVDILRNDIFKLVREKYAQYIHQDAPVKCGIELYDL